ncbi:hypothetical protein ACNFU2_18950 [Chryseobacterium sp. PTM-20240506]|uniref:hypothetical protein n=1 Tax=unclassified Chryseobacterium TaxID=2593645 RepID=UPI001552257A|nr:hypothetical protein [Chryseobacterium sp. LAM-KRS1]
MRNLYILIVSLLLSQISYAQNTDTDFYNSDFKWKIQIPKNFEKVNNDEWAKLQGRGQEVLEKTTGQPVINQSKTIFVFKSDNFNYLEANYQPFDPKVDGNYDESNKAVNEVLYKAFKENMPKAKFDTISTKEKINNLVFNKYTIKMTLPNNMILEFQMYSRLFDKKEFSVNLMFLDPKKGEQMINAWKASQFGK